MCATVYNTAAQTNISRYNTASYLLDHDSRIHRWVKLAGVGRGQAEGLPTGDKGEGQGLRLWTGLEVLVKIGVGVGSMLLRVSYRGHTLLSKSLGHQHCMGLYQPIYIARAQLRRCPTC